MTSFLEGRVLPVADRMDRVIKQVSASVIYVTTAILLVALTLNVLFRYILPGGGLNWLNELPEHFFPWMIAAGVILAAQHNAHIAVDFVIQSLPPRAARMLAISIQVLLAITYLIFAKVALTVSEIVSVEYSSLLHISRSYAYYALVFLAAGAFLTSMSFILRIYLFGLQGLPEPNAEESIV